MRKKDINVICFEQPKNIYLPFDNKDSVVLGEDRIVNVDDKVAVFKNGDVFSMSSGRVLGISKGFYNHEEINTIVVENDYKDLKRQIVKVKPFFNYSKNDIKNIMLENNLIKNDMSKIVLKINFIKKYENSDYLIAREYQQELLDTLDKIAFAYDTKEIFIFIDKRDKLSMEEFSNFIGIYPNIKIIKKLSDDYSTYDIREIVDFNNILRVKNRRRYCYMSVVMNGVLSLVKLKKYTSIKELCDYLKKSSDKVYDFDNKLINPATVVDDNLRGIIIK